MSARVTAVAALLVFAVSAAAQVAVEVELVPERPGPYYTGESLTVDVWLHNRFSRDVVLRDVQFDFSRTDPAIDLAETFEFDLSAIPLGFWTNVFPELPVPRAEQGIACICPERFIPFLIKNALHIGSIGVTIPGHGGSYQMDLENASAPPTIDAGIRLVWESLSPFAQTAGTWTAFDGEVGGATIDFTVEVQPIPAVSTWGLAIVLLGVLVTGTVVFAGRRGRQITLISC